MFLFLNYSHRLLVLLYLIFSSFWVYGQGTKSPNNKPNIIFILSDDHSVPFLGCYGNSDLKTPNLDKLAQEGIRFNRAYTTASQCVPSRASLMTGRSVLDVEMSRFSAPLPAEVKTFPEWLRSAGYYTGICGRSYHLDGALTTKESEETFKKYKLQTFKNRVDYLRVSEVTDQIFNDYFTFLKEVPKNKPFFLQIGYSDPHRAFNAKTFEPSPEVIRVPASMPDTPLLRKDLAAFYGEVQRLDHEVGRILDELKKQGLDKNTLVVFMGDNGSALLRGKGTLYNLGVNVPLIMRFPGKIKPRQVSNALISGEDIAPTFLQTAGVSIPGEVTGKSFWPLLQNKPYQNREEVFAVRVAHASGLPTSTSSFDLSRTVITDKYKLIYNVLWQLPYSPIDFSRAPFWTDLAQMHQAGTLDKKFSYAFFAPQRPMFELFDLAADPDEFNNLAGKAEYKAIEDHLKAKLHEWMILNRDYVPLPVAANQKKVD